MNYIESFIFYWPDDRLTGWFWYSALVALEAVFLYGLLQLFTVRFLHLRSRLFLVAVFVIPMLVPGRIVVPGSEYSVSMPAMPLLVLSFLQDNRTDILAAGLMLAIAVGSLVLLALILWVPWRYWLYFARRPHLLPRALLKFMLRVIYRLIVFLWVVVRRIWIFIIAGELLYLLRYLWYFLQLISYYAAIVLYSIFRFLAKFVWKICRLPHKLLKRSWRKYISRRRRKRSAALSHT